MLQDVWSCHMRGKWLSSYSQIPRTLCSLWCQQEGNPIDQQAAAKHHLMACSAAVCSFKISSASCIASAFCQWDSYGPGAATLKMGLQGSTLVTWLVGPFLQFLLQFLMVGEGGAVWWQYMTFIILDQKNSKRIHHNMPANLRASSPSAFLPSSASTCPSITKTQRLLTTANIVWRSLVSHIRPCWSCPHRMFPSDGIIKPMNPSLGRDYT